MFPVRGWASSLLLEIKMQAQCIAEPAHESRWHAADAGVQPFHRNCPNLLHLRLAVPREPTDGGGQFNLQRIPPDQVAGDWYHGHHAAVPVWRP